MAVPTNPNAGRVINAAPGTGQPVRVPQPRRSARISVTVGGLRTTTPNALAVTVAAQSTVTAVLATAGVTYYVSPTGSDAANGLTTGTAWQTLAKVNSVAFNPGDTILLQGGQAFAGPIFPASSGTTGSPITFGSYGTGKATINVAGNASDGITLYDRSGFVVQDLIVTGPGAATATQQAINLYNDTGSGMTQAVTIRRCDVSGFKYGIIAGGDTKGWMSLLIEDCAAHANQVGGIVTYGPTFTGSNYVNTNVTVRRCTANSNLGNAALTTTNGSGIVLGSVNTGLIELSSATGNGVNCTSGEGPVGIWAYDSNGVVIQRCIAYSNRTNGGDGGGFDFDQDSTNCTIQYCLAYDNDGPGFLIASGGTQTSSGNTIRFNISWGNCHRSAAYGELHLFGAHAGSCAFYGNTVVASDGSCVAAGTVGGVTPTGITFRNNIFVQRGAGYVIESDAAYNTSQVLFQGNAYYKAAGLQIKWPTTIYTTLAGWRAIITGEESVSSTPVGFVGDPLLTDTTTAPTATDPNVTRDVPGLHLTASSSLKAAGLDLLSLFSINTGGVDYLAKPLNVPYSPGAVTFTTITPASPSSITHTRGQGALSVSAAPIPITLGPLGLSRTTAGLFPNVGLYPDTNLYPQASGGGTGDRRLGTVVIAATSTLPLAGTATAVSTVTASVTVYRPVASSVTATSTVTAGLGIVIAALAGTCTAVSTVTPGLAGGVTAPRRLGLPVVTAVGIVRPTGQAHIRRLGTTTVAGRAVVLTGLVHTRALGTPIATVMARPPGQARVRKLGPPSVNARIVAPAGLHHTRAGGATTVTVVWVMRPDAQRHNRGVSAVTVRGRLILGPPSLVHVRAQGAPQISGHVNATGLIHARRLGVAEVNVRFLTPIALTRL